MNYTLSTDAKFYRLTSGNRTTWGNVTAGVHEGPAPANLAEMTTIEGDLSTALTFADHELNMKGRKSTVHIPTMSDGPLEFRIVHDPSNADWIALHSAALMRSTVPIAMLSGNCTVAGVEGQWADWAVLDFGREEKIKEILMNSIKLAPGLSALDLEHVKVTP